jgi:hypothetical protein
LSNPPSPSPERWAHLDLYERKYVRKVIIAYDEILQLTEDIFTISRRYNLNIEAVQRAKDYAFGSGVSRHQFLPDEDMAAAWNRMASGQGIDIDEVFLNHEVFESNLVVHQSMTVDDAHTLAQAQYPWSELLKQKRRNE